MHREWVAAVPATAGCGRAEGVEQVTRSMAMNKAQVSSSTTESV